MSKSIENLALSGLVHIYSKENEILYVFRGGLPAINYAKRSGIMPWFSIQDKAWIEVKTRDKNLMHLGPYYFYVIPYE